MDMIPFLLASLTQYGSCSLEMVLKGNGTVLAYERMIARSGKTASVHLIVPKDLEPEIYDVSVRNLELDGREMSISFDEMSLEVVTGTIADALSGGAA